MALWDPLLEKLADAKASPEKLKALGKERLADVIDQEAARARRKLDELMARYPSAAPRELAQRFVDDKKQLASMVGGITGVFGLATVPVDYLGMTYLQLSLLVEVATVFKVNLKPQTAKTELLDLFGYANGLAPAKRLSPRVVGSLAAMLFARSGLAALSKAMPLVAAPVSAYLNNQHIQKVGETAMRHYDGWGHAHRKASAS